MFAVRDVDSLIAATALAAAYLFGARLAPLNMRHPRRWISAAAGASLSYVFLDLIPLMSERQEAFTREVSGQVVLSHEWSVYISALAGFVLFYGLDTMAVSTRTTEHTEDYSHHRGSLIFRMNLAGFAAYSAMVGYLLVGWPRGLQSLALYTAAMTFHFLVIDHSLRTEYGDRRFRLGRWVLIFAVYAGWLIGASTRLPERVLAPLVGFIAGGVIINSLRDELPKEGEGRFIPFAMGAAVYSLVLLFT